MRTLWLLPFCFCLACTTHTRERTSPPITTPAPEASKPSTTDPASAPEELGAVHWLRDLKSAQDASRAQNKPIFLLFTEVPGCSTVRGFAHDVLTHPLLVEALETEFIPVAIYNNVEGPDRAILKSFGEPTWNNPVVRIIDAQRRPLSPRYSGPYHIEGLLPHMMDALRAMKRPIPAYLQTLANAHATQHKQAVFSMACFWSGETHLGGLDGVVSSRTGFSQGAEVVEVTYDPTQTSREQLSSQYGTSPLPEGSTVRGSLKDDKYQLKHTTWRFVPMTSTQASRVNAALGQRKDPSPWLSPRQRALHQRIAQHPRAGWPDALHTSNLAKSWLKAQDFARSLTP